MFKKSVLLAILMIGSLFGSMPQAEAKTRVFIGIGVPLVAPIGRGYGGYCYGRSGYYCQPRARYYGGNSYYYAPRRYYAPRQYYAPRYNYAPRHYYAPRRAVYPRVIYANPRTAYRLSCNQAKIRLLNRGWRIDGTRDCNGSVYSFSGWQGNKRYRVDVSAENGRVLSRRRF